MSGSWRSKIGGDSHEIYSLNFDGSHVHQRKKIGVGCIIRDNQGNLIVAASYNLSKEFSNYCDVAIAEAAALRNGLKLAKESNVKLNIIRGDNEEVINHVAYGCKCGKRSFKKYLKGVRQPLSGIIHQIVGMLDRSEKIELIYREANQVADKLASLGSSELLNGSYKLFINNAELPPQVAKLINNDKSRISMVENISTLREELIKLQGSHKIATSQKTCGPKVCEVELLEGKVCKKCDELQAMLTKKDKRIAELELHMEILMNQKLKLERKGRDLEKSMDTMSKKLCQMHDEKMKAKKRKKYESMIVVMVGIFIYFFFLLLRILFI